MFPPIDYLIGFSKILRAQARNPPQFFILHF